ncbi:uncharacterized protein CMU_022810 [Cryptosporidium muris RN66]|uniref:Uncharacterized protein n=1 Tax=Cryptosporidium muris (strain RN66) TaxID=441375 RepID=B6ABS3_CRYMR|nr:uncharacterized protein CMU_022810 [Cryptosporidium muris RN66]EEA05276.1 hypothetical protein CMU_022810 [Cryptosporidium muris RN66]|eukprot:XP_002139625.1 hypothetical protein [Cryptosporidium muris RN66]
MKTNGLHIVQNHIGFNWDLIKSDVLSSLCFNNTVNLDHYFVGQNNISELWFQKTIDSLSRGFVRMVSTEMQIYATSRSTGRYSFFISDCMGENLYKFDPYKRSTMLRDFLLNTLTNSLKYSNIHKSNKSQYKCNSPTNNFSNIVKNILQNNVDMDCSIILWCILPPISSRIIKSTDNNTFQQMLECIIKLCQFEMEKLLVNFCNIDVNIIFLLHFRDTLKKLDLKLEFPIAVISNESSQVKVTCLDSEKIIDFMDIIICKCFNLVPLEIGYFPLYNMKNNNSITANFFINKNGSFQYILDCMSNNKTLCISNNAKSNIKELPNIESEELQISKLYENNSEKSNCEIYISDSEEGEIMDECELNLVIYQEDFNINGWNKIIPVIKLDLLGEINNHWQPISTDWIPLANPIGKNSSFLLSAIRNHLNSNGLVLGYGGIPLAVLLHSINSVTYNNSKSNIILNKSLSPFTLAILDRNPSIITSLSRFLICEYKIHNACKVYSEELNNPNIIGAISCFLELFKQFKISLPLEIVRESGYTFHPQISIHKDEMVNLEYKLSLRESMIRIKQNNSLCCHLDSLLNIMPILLSEIHSDNKIDIDKEMEFQLKQETELLNKIDFNRKAIIHIMYPILRRTSTMEFLKSNPLEGYSWKSNIISQTLALEQCEDFLSMFLGYQVFKGKVIGPDNIEESTIEWFLNNYHYSKKYIPSFIWETLLKLLYSLRHVSRQHKRLLYIINHGKDVQISDHLSINRNVEEQIPSEYSKVLQTIKHNSASESLYICDLSLYQHEKVTYYTSNISNRLFDGE